MTKNVLIIGGGLAGPCLALSLARINIRSTIFEIRQSRSESGGSISLAPDALKVLDKYTGVCDRVLKAGFPYQRFGAYSQDGEQFGNIAVGQGEKGYPAIRIMRSTLTKTLFDATEEQASLISIKYGARIERIEEDEEKVTAYFADGSTETGDILVGADGIHSKVRDYVLGDQAVTPTFDGICVVNGFVPIASAIKPSPEFTFPAFVFTSSGMLMTIPVDCEAQTLAWGINLTLDDRSREEWQELERSGEAARLAKADYDEIMTQPVRSLLDNADDAAARLWPNYSIPDIPTWHASKVCLIGDAAHALPPNGQGTALAFEDAALLTRLLVAGKHKDYAEMFSRFEDLRRPRIQKLRNSKIGGTFKGKTGPMAWYLKKWAFRAFFWWNSGILKFGNETAYDVDQVDL